MVMQIILKSDFQDFINNLIKDDSYNVIGVQSRGNKFAFSPLQKAEELSLDYDVTLLPPKNISFRNGKPCLLMIWQEVSLRKNPKKQKPW